MLLMLMTKQGQEKLARDMAEIAKKKSQWGDVWKRLFRNKRGVLGMGIVVLLLIFVLGANFFTNYDYAVQDVTNRYGMPGREHLMGTDNYGRDIFTRLLYGGRISLMVSMMSVIISGCIGIALGSIAGYFGGRIDLVITRLLDILMAIPALLMAIAISSALGSGPVNTALAISVSGIPHSMRIMRSTVLSIKSNDFVEAARATGSKHMRIIFRHILPNTVAPLIVNSTLQIGGNIMAISGLSFIGLGVQPPTPEWGSILAAGRIFIRDFWPIIVFPAMCIMLTVFGFNMFGDGLRDALDPRLKD
ncbi:MAG: ABC transporter permease [Clostridiales bacterium]|nr:ABC transporter permease [Clostridiales bacterium]